VTAVYLATDALTDQVFADIVYEMFRSATLRVTSTDVQRLFQAFWEGLDPESGKSDKAILRAVVVAADAFTSAGYGTMAVAMQALDNISFAEMVDAFDEGAKLSLSQIATALDATTASATQIMQALEDELDVTRYDTAKQLLRIGYGIRSIIQALIDVYDAGYDSVFDVLEYIGFSPAQILAVICDFFPC
jgi:hypothetical protein